MRASGSEVTSPALGNQGMDMRIPFQIPPEGMQDADKARSKVFGLVKLEEHTQDDIPDRMKQAVKKGMVLKKKDAEFFRNDKDTMPVNAGSYEKPVSDYTCCHRKDRNGFYRKKGQI